MEYTLRSAPNSNNKKFSVFKLHKDDTLAWNETKMRRDNVMQPWQIKSGSGKTSRRFKAIKEGGVNENASYFVFYKSNEKQDTYDVCPVDEWFSISATQRYKTLTAEEAEQKFEQRHKMFNLMSVMHSKKNGEKSEEGVSGQDSKSAFKVSEFDDWNDQSGDDDGSENENEDSDDAKKKARKKKSIKKEKEDPEDAPDEAKEESDEGDFEQREVDYMSDSSSDSSDLQDDKPDEADVKGVAEEEALRDFFGSDDEDEDGGDSNAQQKNSKSGDKKLAPITSDLEQEANLSDDSSDSDDYDVDDDKMDVMFEKKGLQAQMGSLMKQEIKQEPEASGSGVTNIGSGTAGTNAGVTGKGKRKVAPESSSTQPPQPPPKRPCVAETSVASNAQEKVIEDLIRKYLSRKPMTLKVLLKNIRSKLKRLDGNSPDTSNELVNTIASIIKRLQPERQKINEVTYLSLKS